MSRVDAVRIAIEKAQDVQPELLAGSALASDAYFPFADGPQLAIDAGRHARSSSRAARCATRTSSPPSTRPAPRWSPPTRATSATEPAPRAPLGRLRIARMCRNIRNLYNFEPPATDEEVHASSLQYVRKISGFTKPSQANEAAFERAVEAVAAVSRQLLDELVTNAPPKDREVEAAKARARAAQRYAA